MLLYRRRRHEAVIGKKNPRITRLELPAFQRASLRQRPDLNLTPAIGR
jgi:hypothetical protein